MKISNDVLGSFATVGFIVIALSIICGFSIANQLDPHRADAEKQRNVWQQARMYAFNRTCSETFPGTVLYDWRGDDQHTPPNGEDGYILYCMRNETSYAPNGKAYGYHRFARNITISFPSEP